MVKPVIYVSDKYEFLSSLILQCYRIPQLKLQIESLAVTYQLMS